jgi:alpha-L-rhamnosidase
MTKKLLHQLILFLTFFISLPVFAQSPLQPGSLTCEYIRNPLGIESASPRLGWTLASRENNQLQSAYEIMVSDERVALENGEGNIWQTAKVQSQDNVSVRYLGESLKPFTRYFWRIRVYDQNDQASEWSDVAWFETAMLKAGDWRAKWIGDGKKNPARDEDYFKDDRMPLFRKEFSADRDIAAARLYISGVGYCEAYINGKKVGDNVLDPGWTTYKKQVLYTVHDITPLVRSGQNVAGVMLGNGWWNPLPIKFFGRWDLRQYQETGRPCVKAEIHIQYTDESTQIIPTDESWESAPGPVVRNNVYLGEHYDARLEQPEWSTMKANSKNWSKVTEVVGPSGQLSVQMQPPIKVTRVLKPVRITEPRPDTFIIDFGQNFAGVARLNVKGQAGKKVTVRYGEDVYKDGTLNFHTTVMTQIRKGGIPAGPGAPPTAWQEDSYTLKGKGQETWAPKFTNPL